MEVYAKDLHVLREVQFLAQFVWDFITHGLVDVVHLQDSDRLILEFVLHGLEVGIVPILHLGYVRWAFIFIFF